MMGEVNKIYGYEIRSPYESENVYFKKNPHVAGMAAEDNKIILNPFSKLRPEQQGAVLKNEAVRLFLREKKVVPDFDITTEQRQSFIGTPYEKDEMMLKHTLLGRILSGDTSAGIPTQQQIEWANMINKMLDMRK